MPLLKLVKNHVPLLKGKWEFLMFSSGYLVFLFIGAAMFLALEKQESIDYRTRMQAIQRDFLRKYPCVDRDALLEMLATFETANVKGVHASHNFSVWSFEEAVFFATAIVTTIGYGTLAPITSGAKLFTIFYSVIGIPLTLTVASAIVDRLSVYSQSLLHWVHSKLEASCEKLTIKVVHLLIILTIAAFLAIIIPSMIFYFIEPDWNYLDSVYYCFTTITTSGFGDYTPGTSVAYFRSAMSFHVLYKLCAAVYIFSGTVYMMLVLSVFYGIRQLNLNSLYTARGDTLSVHTIHSVRDQSDRPHLSRPHSFNASEDDFVFD